VRNRISRGCSRESLDEGLITVLIEHLICVGVCSPEVSIREIGFGFLHRKWITLMMISILAMYYRKTSCPSA
jgi:hypothetical protein